jgi:hypothetical protein
VKQFEIQIFTSKLLLTILFVLLLIGSLDSFLFAGGKYGGASLELGLSGRALALGEATVAQYGDGAGFQYNPACISLLDYTQLNLLYAPSFGGFASAMASYNYAGVTIPLPGGGTAAFNWSRYSVDDIPIYPELKGSTFADRRNDKNLRPDGQTLGFFQDTEDVYYFSFSRNWKTKLPLGWLYVDLPIEIPIGLNLKILRQSVYNASASGMGLDLGTLIKFNLGVLFDKRLLGDIVFGYSVLDITRTTIIWDTKHEDSIQRTHSFGMSYHQKMGWKSSKIIFYWTNRNKYASENLFGIEYILNGHALRLGKNREGISAGMGLRLWRFQLNYAFVTMQLDNAHRIGFSMKL